MSNAFVSNPRQLMLRVRILRLISTAAVIATVVCIATVPAHAQSNRDRDASSDAEPTRRQPLSPTGIDIEQDLVKSHPDGEDPDSTITNKRLDSETRHEGSEQRSSSAMDSTSATLDADSTEGEAPGSADSNASLNDESTNDAGDNVGDRRLLPPDPRDSNASSSANADGDGDKNSLLPPLFGEGSDWPIRLLGSLGLIIGILFFIRPLLKRIAGPLAQGRAHSGLIESLARYPFGRNQSLVLLKLNTRILLICQTPQGSSLLTEFTDPDDVSSILQCVEDDRGGSFSKQFDDLLNDTSSENESRGIAGLFGFKQTNAVMSSPTAASSDGISVNANADVVDLTQSSRGGSGLGAWLGKRAPAK